MCRPTSNTKSRRRVSLESVINAAGHSNLYVPQKVALHKQYDTASTSSTSDSSHYSAVTGRYSDIAEDYCVSNLVFGSGHYGTVRQCIRRATGELFAVKSIEKSKINRLDHLQREVQLLSVMKHENIMNMVDCYEDADYVHIVTEKYTGGELFDKIINNTTNHGCFSETEAAKIIKQLLKAVSYLHENDIVHRDIKPENILFESKDQDSSIRLIDFGLSRTHSEEEAPMTSPVGTCYYMSPELLKGTYTRSTDLWSIGIVAYILICGYPPFNGNDDSDIVKAIKTGHYTFTDGWDGVSNVALDFIKCLLRRDPRKRLTAEEALMHPWLKSVAMQS
jgi:serine/threonine protein kinase